MRRSSVKLDVADGQPGDGFEAVVELVGPVADVGLAVIGLGEDVGDPEGDEPAEGESLMMGVWLEVTGRGDGGSRSLDEEAEDQGDVVDAFVSQVECGGMAVLQRGLGKSVVVPPRSRGEKIQGKFM